MLIRKCLDYVKEWHGRQTGRKPLLIRGARQVGKTTLVRILAEELGEDLVEIDLERPWKFTSTLVNLDPFLTIEAIEFEMNVDVDPGRSILFFDEAQACPEIFQMLRYFYEKAPQYCVVVTGSLLEFVLSEPDFSMPVGRIDFLHLSPLTFEEFVLALDELKALEFLKSYELKDDLPRHVHDKLSQLARLYSIVGGMPEAVSTFIECRSFKGVERVKSGIIDTLRLDFYKYHKKADTQLLTKSFDSIPNLMGKKLIYSRIDKTRRSADVTKAVQQLCLARVIAKVFKTSANGVPLAAERDERFFKILFLDVGLCLSQLRLAPTEVDRVEELNLVNKGIVAEQLIGQELYALSPLYTEPELYYWLRERKASSAEVDYVIQGPAEQVVPIEVKAGSTGSLRSLQIMVVEKKLNLAVRFNSDPPSVMRERRRTLKGDVDFKLISLPHYLVSQLPRLLQGRQRGQLERAD